MNSIDIEKVTETFKNILQLEINWNS
jgi:hypothetical protein